MHIFLSYHRSDTRMMQEVKSALESAGAEVWTDQALEPGTHDWIRAVDGAIRGAGCFVVLLSPASAESEWVGKEISRALRFNKKVIPALIDGRQDEIVPLELERKQFVDVRSGDRSAALQRLADIACQHVDFGVAGGEDEYSEELDEPDELEVSGADDTTFDLVGSVLHYYPRVEAATVELTGPIQMGDFIYIGDGESGYFQRVDSIQVDRQPVNEAWPGQQVGLRVDLPVGSKHVVERVDGIDRAQLIGVVTEYYSGLQVAGVELFEPLEQYDVIEIRNPDQDCTQAVESIHLNGEPATYAAAFETVGIKVEQPVGIGDRVYKLED